MSKPLNVDPSLDRQVQYRRTDSRPTLYGCPICLHVQGIPGRGRFACDHGGFVVVMEEIMRYDYDAKEGLAGELPPSRQEVQAAIAEWTQHHMAAFWRYVS